MVWPVVLRPKSGKQLLFRGVHKGIFSQDTFRGTDEFSVFFTSSLSQLQAFDESVGGYTNWREGKRLFQDNTESCVLVHIIYYFCFQVNLQFATFQK
jgi:hypothetical protein